MAWTISHWVYLLGAIVVLFTMLRRKGVVVPSILATFCLGLTYHHSIVAGIGTIFQASLFSAQKLFNIYLIIAVMVGLLKTLEAESSGPVDVAANREMDRRSQCGVLHPRYRDVRLVRFFLAGSSCSPHRGIAHSGSDSRRPSSDGNSNGGVPCRTRHGTRR